MDTKTSPKINSKNIINNLEKLINEIKELGVYENSNNLKDELISILDIDIDEEYSN